MDHRDARLRVNLVSYASQSEYNLMVNVTKLYPKHDCSDFDAFGRDYSGEIQTGQTLRVLG